MGFQKKEISVLYEINPHLKLSFSSLIFVPEAFFTALLNFVNLGLIQASTSPQEYSLLKFIAETHLLTRLSFKFVRKYF